VAAAYLGLGSRSAQNEPAQAFVEHLRRAGPELLTVEIAIEADAREACPILRLIGEEAPRHFTGLVEYRVEENV
jgi:hypothetical protein